MSNVDVIERSISSFGKTVNLVYVMEQIANEVMAFLASSNTIPVDTGNLKDSTGIGIYFGDVLIRYVPNPIAKVPRKNLGITGYEKGEVWGKNVIQEALDAGAKRYRLGYHLVLFSSMPYAQFVNKKNPFFNILTRDLNNVINSVTAKYGNIIHVEDTK